MLVSMEKNNHRWREGTILARHGGEAGEEFELQLDPAGTTRQPAARVLPFSDAGGVGALLREAAVVGSDEVVEGLCDIAGVCVRVSCESCVCVVWCARVHQRCPCPAWSFVFDVRYTCSVQRGVHGGAVCVLPQPRISRIFFRDLGRATVIGVRCSDNVCDIWAAPRGAERNRRNVFISFRTAHPR